MGDLFVVEQILPRRGGPSRGGKRNGLCFTVKWVGFDELSDEPIENFVETDAINSIIVDYLSRFNDVAKNFPFRKRLCVCCDTRVRNGKLLCNRTYCKSVKQCLIDVYDLQLI